MGRYIAEACYIASIYPGQLNDIVKHVGENPDPQSPRSTRYHLEPVPRGEKPYVIMVSDMFENVVDWLGQGQGSTPELKGRFQTRHTSKPVDCARLAQNLLQEWSGGMVGVPTGAAPGIMIIEHEEPTPQECRQMLIRQTAFAEFQFNEAEKLARMNDYKGITRVMIDMSTWLGRSRPWSNPEAEASMVECPVCTGQIKSNAFVCRHCGYKVKALPPEIAALNAETNTTTGTRPIPGKPRQEVAA